MQKGLFTFDFKIKLTILTCLVRDGLVYWKFCGAAIFKGIAKGLADHNYLFFFFNGLTYNQEVMGNQIFFSSSILTKVKLKPMWIVEMKYF